MKIIFTICSNNYLAQAKALGDSIKNTNPNYIFFIGLVDKLSDKIDYENDITYPIILCDELRIPNFDDLWKKYSIVEFNTCVKPFYFNYFIQHYPDLDYLFYLDPDTYVFNSFDFIEHEFQDKYNILLTPHILSPIEFDGKSPTEALFLNYGIYNLGFLGLKIPSMSIKLIDWWKERTYNFGFDRPSEGLFVDQLWFNLVPLLFENVKVSNYPGLNMAPWNLHERKLEKDKKNINVVNKIYPLVFYHFSSYKYLQPNIIASYYNRYSFEKRNYLFDIYQAYHEQLIANKIEVISNLSCIYMDMRADYLNNLIESQKKKVVLMKKIYRTVKLFLPPILLKSVLKLKK